MRISPQTRREQLARLAVHIELAGRINAALDARNLVDLGRLEQDLVFGDATSKEVINFLSNHASVPASDKVRCALLRGLARAPRPCCLIPGALARLASREQV